MVVPITFITKKYFTFIQENEKKRKISREFQSFIEILVTELEAGYALENAFEEGRKELCILYGENCYMAEALKRIRRRLAVNEAWEKVLGELSQGVQMEEIDEFIWIVAFAKRSGGNYVEMIRRSVAQLVCRMETEEEISTVIARKRLEQRLMCMAPMGLLLYLNLMSSEYIGILYTSVIGRIVMSICLVIYAIAFFLGERVMNIEV